MRIMDGYRTLARLALAAGLVAIEIWIARDVTSSGDLMGYTQTKSASIAPPTRARVRTVSVELGATVRVGDPIALLDTTELDDAIQTASAERALVIASMQSETSQSRRDTANRERDFASGAERATAALVEAESDAGRAKAELDAIRAAEAEQLELVGKHLASTTLLDSLRLRHAALERQVDAAKLIGVLRDNVAAAKQRTKLDDAEPVLAPLEAQLHAVDMRLDQLARQRDALTLRAPIAGIVEQLLLKPGELAGPDMPLATIVAADSMRVIACIPEARVGTIEVGLEADLTTAVGRQHASGVVESLTGQIAPLPPRCQAPTNSTSAMGRVAVVALDAPTASLPGQTQLISFRARRRPTTTRSPTPPEVGDHVQANRLDVPAALLARTRFEPSGLTWIPSLDRYLVVSDDTGFKNRDDHAPWLFTMTAAGVVDPVPLVVRGLTELDDVESIAADPGGAIWILSSQSASRRGKRPSARQHLVRLISGTDGLRADAVIDLATLIDRLPAPTRTRLGVADTTELDIEGLAVRDGALYVGLKAPLDASGRALIWKIGKPDRVMAGHLDDADVDVWSRLELSVEADGRTVPAGIADLMFLDAQTLLVTASASGLDPVVQSGALYRVRIGTEKAQVQRIRTFPDLKAEGIALAPSGNQLAVVFDRGALPAAWLEIPLAEVIRP